MKRLFAILLVAVLATTFAMAATQLGTAVQGTGTVNVNVIVALQIAPVLPNGVLLGDIAIGDSKNITGKPLEFNVTGNPYSAFTYTALTPVEGNPEHITITFPSMAGANTALDGTGKALLTWPISAVSAETGAILGSNTFTYTTTVAYIY
jgi:hypothetical protein